MTTKIEQLIAQSRQAKHALDAEMEREFPRGTKGTAILQYGQINPTPVTVVGPDGCGMLRVLLDNAKPRSRRPCRTIPYKAFTPSA